MTENMSQTPSHPPDPSIETTTLAHTNFPVGMSKTMAGASSQPTTPPDRMGRQPQADSAVYMAETTVEILREPSTPCPKRNAFFPMDFSGEMDDTMTETSSLPSTPQKGHGEVPQSESPVLLTETKDEPTSPSPVRSYESMIGTSGRSSTPEHVISDYTQSELLVDIPNQGGVEWVQELLNKEPSWTKEPDIEIIMKIAHEQLGYDANTPIEVTYFAQGGFNKLYKISGPDSDYMMRVALPVDPHHKTESEVATTEAVRHGTDIPVPRIYAFNSDNQNELHFEWILMEMMPGVPLRTKWRKMSWEAKERLIKRLAKYQAQLCEKSFEAIGNLFFKHAGPTQSAPPKEILTPSSSKTGTEPVTETTESPTMTVYPERFAKLNEMVHNSALLPVPSLQLGRIVSIPFFYDKHLTYKAPRGPFKTSHEWLKTRLQFVVTDSEHITATSDDEDEIAEAGWNKDMAEKLLLLLPDIFPHDLETGPCVLHHDDLSSQNILVDENGELTAVLDWECVSTMPLWRACQLPKFLEGKTREKEPVRSDYSPRSEDDDSDEDSDDDLDHEGIADMYWDDLLEYEQTQLRKVFLSEMEEINPEWVAMFKSSTFKNDLDMAVGNADNVVCERATNEWIEAFRQGNIKPLGIHR